MNNNYIATIRTSVDSWGYIISDDIDYFKSAIINCIVISKLKWPDESVKVITDDLSQQEIEQLKKTAHKKVK